MGVIRVRISGELFLENFALDTDPKAQDIKLVGAYNVPSPIDDDKVDLVVFLKSDRFPETSEADNSIGIGFRDANPLFQWRRDTVVINWQIDKEEQRIDVSGEDDEE